MNFFVRTDKELSCLPLPPSFWPLLLTLSSSSSSSSPCIYSSSLVGVFFVGLFLINQYYNQQSLELFRAKQFETLHQETLESRLESFRLCTIEKSLTVFCHLFLKFLFRKWRKKNGSAVQLQFQTSNNFGREGNISKYNVSADEACKNCRLQHINFLMQNQYIIENQQHPEGQLQHSALPYTIIADTTSNTSFVKWQLSITVIMFFIFVLLKPLPSPVIINKIENDPEAFTKELCEGDQECSSVQEGYESIMIKKINSFQRQLKYFVKLNYERYESLSKYFNNTQVDLNNEITWIEIYASRSGQTYGEVLYEKSGEDIYEIFVDDRPLIFVGEVHVLKEQNYIIKIYKLIKTFKVYIEGEKPLNMSIINQANQRNSSQQQSNYREVKISIPLTVQIFRYSQFYTVIELIIRYVSLLIILFVRGQTSKSPVILHYILILTSNPLIFIEIAFPSTLTNLISTICSSMYLMYLLVFLYYCHSTLHNRRLDLIFKVIKLLIFCGFWIAYILRQPHLVNHTKIQLLQTILLIIVLLPLFNHLWTLYFFKSKTILHRDVVFITLTLYFLLLYFFSDYLVFYGWKKLTTYLIVQIYGCQLCFLTAPYVNKESTHEGTKYEQVEKYESCSAGEQQKKQELLHAKIGQYADSSPEDSRANQDLYIKVQ